MADKQITVGVPEERVAEFYAWFAEFLSAAPTGGDGPSREERGGPPGPDEAGGPGAHGAPFGPPWRGGRRGHRGRHGFGPRSGFSGPGRPDPSPWSSEDTAQAAWIYRKLSGGARQLFDLLIDHPGERFSGNELARRLELEKGSHGVAGVLAWPGRWCRKLGRPLPIETSARDDGGTDFSMNPELTELFRAARDETDES